MNSLLSLYNSTVALHERFNTSQTVQQSLNRFTEEYSMSSIRFAVYEAPGADEWQKFRVSLKGLTTREKLYALMWYWEVHIAVGAGSHKSPEDWSREIIRVNNYLGALKRGGQLDSALRVVKG